MRKKNTYIHTSIHVSCLEALLGPTKAGPTTEPEAEAEPSHRLPEDFEGLGPGSGPGVTETQKDRRGYPHCKLHTYMYIYIDRYMYIYIYMYKYVGVKTMTSSYPRPC